MATKVDLIGKTFGWLTVEKQGPHKIWPSGAKAIQWVCRCACGKERLVVSSVLIRGVVKSCGCKNFMVDYGSISYDDPAKSTWNAILRSYKIKARRRELVWGLDEEKAMELFKSNCHYCGTPPRNKKSLYMNKNGTYGRNKFVNEDRIKKTFVLFNGIDRKDNGKGYIVENCVPCCSICNMAKHQMPYEGFLGWLKMIAKFWEN